MTVQEAKTIINMILEEATSDEHAVSYVTDCQAEELKIAIECMEEIEQYRALGTVEELKEAKKLLEKLEELKFANEQPKTDWIPCEERLPSEDEEVIISTKTERVYIGVYTTRYGENKREGFICEDGFMWMNVANAWQPLPQPYKREGAENG